MPQAKAKGSDRRSKLAEEVGMVPPLVGTVKRGPGRPPVHCEEWTKATVVLFNRQIQFLDRLAAGVRERNGTPASRAQLIRALVDAVAASDVDLTAAGSEAEMKAMLVERLGRVSTQES
jgi:hypothetical protein